MRTARSSRATTRRLSNANERKEVPAMAKRRGKGEGSIVQRADGRWMGRVDLGRGPDGRRQRKTVYGATRQAVAEQLNRDLGRSSSGELLTTSTPRLSTLLDDWHATHQ